MIRTSIGIDTSVLARLATGQPPDLFARCVERLRDISSGGAEVLASNQVIGEAYVALQRHYGILQEDSRAALLAALTSGLVGPLNGRPVLDALSASGGPGLFDRLIANDYQHSGLETLTLDRQMASLPATRLLEG